MPRQALTELDPRRIVLIKPSALGDIINALPVLCALRRRFPRAHITWAVNRVYEPLLQGHAALDATLPFDRGSNKRGWWGNLRSLFAFCRTLRAGNFDLAIDLQGLFRSGLMTWATRAARRVGLAGAREGARWFYTDIVPDPGVRAAHAVDRCWLAAKALGAEGRKEFGVPIPSQAAGRAAEWLRPLPRPWLMLAAGSRWVTKRWPPASFAELARRSGAAFGGSVILVGAPDEAEVSQAVARELTGPVLDLTGRTTLPELAAVLSRADVMLANDTGPLHLAVALGRAVVAPYTCTRTALNGPYDDPGAVETKVWCAGSYRKRCSRLECMAELTPDRLWPVLFEVLSRWRQQSLSA